MDVVILSIGSEILKGRTVNTNATYIAGRMFEAGFNVVQERTVADGRRIIGRALEECFDAAPVVICTGGLGPTRDDVTKTAASEYFGREMTFDEDYFARLEEFFRNLGYDRVPERSHGQAEVPEGAEVLLNTEGTAPGLIISDEERLLVLLPGVPGEMKKLLDEQVMPRLAGGCAAPPHHSATVRTVGIGESTIAARIEEELPEAERELLNYYPHGGFVDIVVAAAGEVEPVDAGTVEKVASHVRRVLENHVYAVGDSEIWEVIAGLLNHRRQTLATAESCTGGLLSQTITTYPGASEWFAGGAATYSDSSKTALLGVPAETIRRYGAVSERTATAMAAGAKEKFSADWSLSITGIAGPGGGTDEKPVGTVFIGLCSPDGERAERFGFNGNRGQIRHRSAIKATEILWRALSGKRRD